MVRPCNPPGLLGPLVHISLIDRDEDTARGLLVSGVNPSRAKPIRRPAFPGVAAKPVPKTFPGPSAPSPYMPKVNRSATDAEKRRFVRQTFDTIKEHFDGGLHQLSARNDGIECDFQPNTATDFTAEVFLNGKTRCSCRIWQGGLASSDGISYAEGRLSHGTNATNEVLSISDEGGDLHLVSLMGGIGFGDIEHRFDLKHMMPDQAADYLWRRFLKPLER